MYDYNSRSIARLLDSASTSTSTSSTAGAGDVAVQVEGMFQKTMGLLDKKVELLQEHRRSLDPTSLQVQDTN